MKAAVMRLARLARAPDNQRTLRELGFAYADIAPVAPGALRWDLIILDRTNERWRALLALARLLLGDRLQQTSAGATDGHALLFEMNVLFETYVARLLSRALAGTGYRVSAQGGQRDCLYEGATGRFRTRPDLIVRRGERVALIIDTKWKRMSPRIDDPKQEVSQADVYQLMAYSQLYECPRVMLLYPHHAGLPQEGVEKAYGIAAPDSSRLLSVAALDVTVPRQASQEALRSLVLRQVRDTSLNPPSSHRISLLS